MYQNQSIGIITIIGTNSLCMFVYIGFKTFFYVVRHPDSIASYLPTGLHLGFFRSWPSLFLPFSFSSVFLVVSFVSASTSMLFWAVFLLPFFEQQRKQTNTKLQSRRNVKTSNRSFIDLLIVIEIRRNGSPGIQAQWIVISNSDRS